MPMDDVNKYILHFYVKVENRFQSVSSSPPPRPLSAPSINLHGDIAYAWSIVSRTNYTSEATACRLQL